MAVTLQQIKDEYAKEEWPDNWEAMSRAMDFLVMNEIAKRYAEACCKATLEKAHEEIGKIADQYPYKKRGDRESYSSERCAMQDAFDLAQQRISDPSNIVLL